MKRKIFTSLAAATAVAASILISSGAAEAAPDAATASSASALGGSITPNSKLPATIQVDETKYKIVSTLRGIGKQVYDCNGSTYAFREPMAGLFTTRGIPAGIHGAGPFWANFDGSKFVGAGAGSAPSPNGPSNIAWLKVSKVSTAGTGGAFSNVEFVQRTDTRGGVAPASCSGTSTVSVDYTTYYVFWAAK